MRGKRYIYIYICVCVCAHSYLYVYIHIYILTYVCMYIYIHIIVYIYIYTFGEIKGKTIKIQTLHKYDLQTPNLQTFWTTVTTTQSICNLPSSEKRRTLASEQRSRYSRNFLHGHVGEVQDMSLPENMLINPKDPKRVITFSIATNGGPFKSRTP